MSVDKIMGQADDYARAWADAQTAEMGYRGTAYAYRAEERAALRDLIAAAIADAKREGAEQMRAEAAMAIRRDGWNSTYQHPFAQRMGDMVADLPLPASPRQAVLLTDAMVDAHADAVLRAAGSSLRHYTMQSSRDAIRVAVRAIQTAVLAANGMGDSHD